jgi:hypothetical protein
MSLLLAALASLAMPALSAPPALDPHATNAWPDIDISLQHDVVHERAASESTIVHAATDGKYLYVRFDVTQSEPVTATQHSDDTGQGSDDYVWVDLWPTGVSGFFYQFEASPNGTHYEQSSENTAYSPHWQAQGSTSDHGYVVTMAIPFSVIHGGHSGKWKIQFARSIHATGEEDVWSYDSTQTNPDDLARAGTATLTLAAGGAAPRPQPRAALYALGLDTTPANGGSTSRVGADLSVPITSTASFFSTLHPDYSNVELDQQTISPTVFQRIISEVRPFFTQAGNFYNNFNCDVCSGTRTILYTPDIPTPSQGYALEGKQGDFGFAGFDAIGDDRTDLASTIDYTSPDTRWSSSLERVQANVPGITDIANEWGTSWSDLKHISAYVNVSDETGNDVSDPGQARDIDAGGGWANQHTAIFGAVRNVGADFNPLDGLDSHPGIAGYALYGAQIWNPGGASKIAAFGLDGFFDRYQGPQFGQSQSDNSMIFDVLTKSAWDLQIDSGSDYWRFGPTLTPISQNSGFSLTYHSGLVTDNPGNFPYHGSSATPTSLQFSTGRYGDGVLDTWFRTSTIRIGTRGTLSLSVDDTAQYFDGKGTDNVQWFDTLSYNYQINRSSSFAIGLRRVEGLPPQPNGGGNCIGDCSNVSLAYYLRLKDEEIYLAYGDPNTLTTVPQAIFKVIFYAGAQKGS